MRWYIAICSETCQRHVPTLWRYRFEKFDVAFYQETILSSGVFRRETAIGFYPWGKVDSPRKRVAEGLCGWRHGNSFPMTQSAQSHRQMRSIPHCPKAVFYVFVFDSIHNSATKHNLSPQIFHWIRFLRCFVGLTQIQQQIKPIRHNLMLRLQLWKLLRVLR